MIKKQGNMLQDLYQLRWKVFLKLDSNKKKQNFFALENKKSFYISISLKSDILSIELTTLYCWWLYAIPTTLLCDSFSQNYLMLLTYPGDKAMAHILRHHFVFLQLLQEHLLVEGQDVLEVTKDDLFFASQRLGKLYSTWRWSHGYEEWFNS